MKKIIFLFCLTIGFGVYADNDAEMQEMKQQQLAREYLTPHLKDPDSAEFRNQKGFCGEVNSNNSLGDKTGFQRFIVSDKDLYVLEQDSGFFGVDFESLWNKMCN
ncbi:MULTISPECIES: hypothetical protein [unclassified Gilliamella]|uniref:hypothetical protein n=1 Tax=unclassified Gilliamella TaxID=2685620 RepID=UPI00080E61FC|nr:hypothetical protein [Gilliamella apicola]OCG21749.1 hypothetical protein A9G23_03990 [Gilliamella apicola]OCG22079.1 hypothetical protein A9G22_08390 [Gilliamella apicola]